MKLYVVINGWMNGELLKCLVCAEGEERALELAKEKFKESYKEQVKANPKTPETYYERLQITNVFDSLDEEWATEVDELARDC